MSKNVVLKNSDEKTIAMRIQCDFVWFRMFELKSNIKVYIKWQMPQNLKINK